MAKILKDSDFEDSSPVLSDSDFLTDAAAGAAGPAHSVLADASRKVLPSGGAMAGAASLAPVGFALGGPWGAAGAGMIGAFMGGYTGSLGQQGFEKATGQTPGLSLAQALNNANREGAVQAVSEGAFRAVGPVSSAIARRGVDSFEGAQSLFAKVDPKFARAATENPAKFAAAPNDDVVSKLYDEMYSVASKAEGRPIMGRKNYLEQDVQVAGNQLVMDPFDSVARAKEDMVQAYTKLQEGSLTTQEAINASQAARKIRDMKLRGNEMAQDYAEEADTLKSQFDDFIQARYPQWQKARDAAFWNAARKEYDALAPQNINKTVSALRGYTGAAMGLGGALTGHPMALALPVLQAPATYGVALKAAGLASIGASKATRFVGLDKFLPEIGAGALKAGEYIIRLGASNVANPATTH